MSADNIFQMYFSPRLRFGRFCWNLILLSVASVLPFLVIFVLLTPDFAKTLLAYPPAASRFFRQVVTNGIPVVFIVNYVGFLIADRALKDESFPQTAYLALDTLFRAIAFVSLHILIYVLSADWFDSFGGDRLTALQVVGPTLARSYLFENISGAYLYALIPGAAISYWTVLSRRRRARTRVAPSGLTAMITVACLGLVLLITLLSSGLSQIFIRS